MNRVLVANTPLGKTWWATSLQGEEGFSSLYEFRLELKSEKSDIDMQELIGETCSVACESNYTAIRYFSGLIINAACKGRAGKHWLYEVLIAPKLWYASQRADFKIFQAQTAQAIADQVLQENAITYEWRLKNSYKTWEYVVQYGETDLAFLLRLLGNEGIYFWFEHTESGEKLILGDHFTVHEPFARYENIPYYPPDASRADEDHFHAWHASRVPEPGKFVHTDYDFKSPSKDLKTECAAPCGHLFDQYEIFAYPGAYIESEHGQEYAAARLQGLQTEQDTILLEGSVRGAVPGCCFTLKKHPVEAQNRDYLITKVHYQARNNDYESTGDAQAGEAYFHAKVSAMPANRQYNTPREQFRMPRTHGPDTAVVVGPSGSEIHTDEYGRVKVHFHWDRYGQKDGSDSCWIRVSYPWAGSNFGGIHIPRVGQEVIIDYEHGDPQRPLVIGRVYNAQQMPPWDLPANKTQSGLLTRSAEGSTANANALRFEDAKGKEQVWLHAEKDQSIEVENDETHWVGNDRTKNIDGNETTTVLKDRTETVEGNETITVLLNRTETVEGNETISVTQNRTETVTGNESIAILQNREKAVTGNENSTISQNKSETIAIASMQNVGAARMDNVGLAYDLNVGAAQINNIGGLYSLNVGAAMSTIVALSQSNKIGSNQTTNVGNSIKTTAGNDITITAGDSITLVVGESKLVMKKDGTISLNGKNLGVHMKDSPGTISIKSDKNMRVESAKGGMTIKSKDDMLVKSDKNIAMKAKEIKQN